MQHILIFDYLRYVLPFGLGSAISTAEEEEDRENVQINQVCVCRTAAVTPGLSFTENTFVI